MQRAAAARWSLMPTIQTDIETWNCRCEVDAQQQQPRHFTDETHKLKDRAAEGEGIKRV
jgi:hypothetical protein